VPLSQNNDPEFHLQRALKKHHKEDMIDQVSNWADTGITSPGGLKKYFIVDSACDDEGVNTIGFDEIDLKDSTTWGDAPIENMPSDEFFIDVSNALKADEKRNSKRSSYSF
jgi:hypothetical protein